MNEKKQYCGLDLLKFIMAVLVAARHMIQVFYPAESRWRLIIGSWLSNLAVPVFFIIAGFLLFRKIPDTDKKSGWPVVGRYAWRIVKLYLLWCVIYWPIDIFNWYHGTATIMETLKAYVHSFFFSSTIAQLWYLPALAVAALIVWTGYRAGLKIWMLLVLAGALFVFGCICDNWYFTERAPMKIQEFVWWYAPKFVTMRNGLFLRKLLPGLGTLVFQKDLVYAGAAFTGRQRAVSGPDVQRGGHLLQYQYGVYRGSGSGLSDRTCHEASGGIFPFLW